jgi:hypothetical protein
VGVGAQARLADRKGTLVQGVGAVEVALVVQDVPEVIEDPGGHRTIGALVGLANSEAALVQRTGGL